VISKTIQPSSETEVHVAVWVVWVEWAQWLPWLLQWPRTDKDLNSSRICSKNSLEEVEWEAWAEEVAAVAEEAGEK